MSGIFVRKLESHLSRPAWPGRSGQGSKVFKRGECIAVPGCIHAPSAARGSGVASVHVQYATPGSQLAQQKLQQESAGGALILPADHPLA